MLGKILKYDLKWIYKVIIVFYILAFIFSVIGRSLSLIENSLVFNIITKISFGIAISMLINSLVNCLLRLWSRFIKNLYKDESYLTHTLPVEKKTIYLSKVLSALICLFTTLVVSIVCLFICYYSEANIEILKTVLELAATTYNTTVLNLLLLISIVIFLELMFIVLIGYVGIILGHKSNKNKMVRTIIIAFAIYLILQVVTLVSIAIYGLFNSDVMNLINTTDIININAIKKVMYLGMGVYVAYIVLLYYIGINHLKKGVNVE